ncbi:uncharacterized protein LOC116801023 [Drosophila sechellia]|uniref:uncharacterized protein LOC116801023 n=1 Tax=Drosophila sechellia TaxID=7238 RepID=UPI0013DD9801|nr:uncharacterized protein LOC116801023 [Drosophila sechellia]
MQSSLVWIPLFTLLLGQQVSAKLLDESCGNSKELSRAGLQAAAWMTAVSNATHFLCGGTLIHERIVLTAARCIDQQVNLFVELGAYNIPDADTMNSRIPVSKAVVHRLFSKSPIQDDIGLLKLSYSVVFSDDIHSMCIIMDKRIVSSVQAIQTFKAFAWAPKNRGLESENLHALVFHRLNQSECNINRSLNQICAGGSDGETSGLYYGNPLTKSVTIAGTIKREVQIGIASSRNPDRKGPVVFTDITSHVDWIAANVERLSLENSVQNADISTGNSNAESVSNPDIWLYKDCGGDTTTSLQMGHVIGINFNAHGVFITENFVLTIARGLPEKVYVLLLETNKTISNRLPVDSIIRHDNISGYHKHDIALLKLMQPVTLGNYFSEGIKPICMLQMLRHQLEAESSASLTRLVPELSENRLLITEHTVELISHEECAKQINSEIEQNQVCVADSTGNTNPNYLRGEVLGKILMYSAKKWVALFGILSYSTSKVHVYTNVMRYTNWIEQTVKSYS